ncbi:MAG: DivIVA domain-containing protein [Lachnospiraceae bacterium]|nr:DivIVA domain-containing protein [Lachnospiraceae bacterium]
MDSKMIKEQRFDRGFRGYNTEEVDVFLEEVAAWAEGQEEQEKKRREEEEKRREQEQAYIEKVEAKASGILKSAGRKAAQQKEEADRLLEEARQRSEQMERLAREGKDACLEDAREEARELLRQADKQAEEIRRRAKFEAKELHRRTTEESEVLRNRARAEAEELQRRAREETETMRRQAGEEADNLRREAMELLDRAKAVEENAVLEEERRLAKARQIVNMMEEAARERLSLINELLERQQEWAQTSREQMEDMSRKQSEIYRKYILCETPNGDPEYPEDKKYIPDAKNKENP